MRGFLLILTVVLALSACQPTAGDFGGAFSPHPFQMRNIPSGDDSYSVGWRDGCQTFTGAVGEGLLRTQPFSYDINRALEDSDYYKGWRAGMTYCTYYTDYDPI
ncbi:MAG: hypothetical protein EB060_07075 [Proteobacteria bacterium]|nr:hypothetical protein [Pseudomonadota bacterium]